MSPHIDHDPIEDDPKIREIIAAADKEAEKLVKKRFKQVKKGQRGYCHVFWGVKQQVLREKYKIEWKSPSDLNPDTRYD
nr:hypothetical protein [Candidatus Sigynarchaeota archaeon]